MSAVQLQEVVTYSPQKSAQESSLFMLHTYDRNTRNSKMGKYWAGSLDFYQFKHLPCKKQVPLRRIWSQVGATIYQPGLKRKHSWRPHHDCLWNESATEHAIEREENRKAWATRKGHLSVRILLAFVWIKIRCTSSDLISCTFLVRNCYIQVSSLRSCCGWELLV